MKRLFFWSLAAIAIALSGCSMPNPVGGRVTQSAGDVALDSPGPNTLTIVDGAKSGSATGAGPARYTSITEGQVQTIQTGTVPRDLFVRVAPDGSKQFNLSTGTDIQAKGLKFDTLTGNLSIAEFSTLTSEPLRAANEGLDRVAKMMETLTPAQRDAQIRFWEVQEAAATGISKNIIAGILAGLRGGL